MSAKHSKKAGKKSPAPTSVPPSSPTPALAAVGAASGTIATTADPGGFTPWIESSDPRKRTWGKVALVVVWIYVAALWLLALDQTFDWGIFGPKVPPVP